MLRLAGAFAERHFQVDLVLAHAVGAYLNNISADVRLVNLGKSRLLKSLPSLVGYMKKERPQVLLSAMLSTNIVALWARDLSRVSTRVIVSEHSTLTSSIKRARNPRERLMTNLARWVYPRADGIVAVSKGVADDLTRVAQLAHHRIETIHNPVVTPELIQRAQEPLHHPWFVPGSPPVILGVGRLGAEKDFPSLIKAVAQVHQQRPVRLIILGDGEDRLALESMVRALGLEDIVDLPGFVNNPYHYMRQASMFVLSSIREGLLTVLIEAMACGCPVISTDCHSGPAEILEHGKYGRLVLPENIRGLANAILASLDESVEVESLYQRANDFSVSKACDRYLQILFPHSG